MAMRSGAGTGVIVTLVVFILTTVFLLVLAGVFYSTKTKAIQEADAAKKDLDRYVSREQRANDLFKGIEAASGAQSVASYLVRQRDDLMRYVNGDASSSLDEMKSGFERLGVGEGEAVRHVFEQTSRDLRSRQTEVENLNGRVASLETEVSEKEKEIAELRESHQRELDMVSKEIVSYREAAEEYRTQLDETIAQLEQAKEDNRERYEKQIRELDDQIDNGNRDVVVLRDRVNEYESLLASFRQKAITPELLVDATVMDVEPSKELVFLDRGKQHRIVLGMTFELYDDAASIAVNPRTQVLPRGKASIEVVKVGEITSTCKITRAVPGRPVVSGNVAANAVYDPNRRFKFLIHGVFDVDGDGRPTEREAEHLHSLVLAWGGEVVEGNDVPGDLDFLLLGEAPPAPPALGGDAPPHVVRDWVKKREASMNYERLLKQASDAQIPVLNQNRFLILIGHTQH
jgi:uncharacterized protein YlxW (UPF0749 family)